MKRRLLWFALGLFLGLIAGYFYFRSRDTAPAASPPPIPVALTEPARNPIPPREDELVVKQGYTLDLSLGRELQRVRPEDRQAIERVQAKMEEAADDMTFEPDKFAPKSN